MAKRRHRIPIPGRPVHTKSPPNVQQVWFADDATGAASCSNLRSWWDTLSSRGPAFGYHPNASKTYLVVKQEHETSARQLFADTEVHITLQGKRHLGAAIGSKSFTEEYVRNKVETWTNEIKRLAQVATSQPLQLSRTVSLEPSPTSKTSCYHSSRKSTKPSFLQLQEGLPARNLNVTY